MKYLFLFVSLFAYSVKAQDTFPVSIIHFNDLHARFEETNVLSNTCKKGEECIGGYARIVSKAKELFRTKADKNPILLNAADNYQGTLWYNVYRWNVTSHFLNLFPANASTIGNHEFDHGVEGLVPFMERSLTPILICNIDDSQEPTFQGLYSKSMVIRKFTRPNGILGALEPETFRGTKSKVIRRFSRSIGIVGVTTTFPSHWGNIKILPEVESVQAEVAKLTAEGIDIIIVLSHCGLDVDREIAKHGGPIDIIVGGHSHSFLFSGVNPPGPDKAVDTYPAIVRQDNGDEVLIVHASAYTKYLGDITLYFDDKGKVVNHEGAPIFLGHDVVPDPQILEELKPWRAGIDELQNRVVGRTTNDLLYSQCYSKECEMGDFVADAFASTFRDIQPDEKGWTGASIAFANPGSIRAGMTKGEIVYGDLVTTTPFEFRLISVELEGNVIRKALEFSVAENHQLQVSGLKVVYDRNKEVNNRIVSLEALCRVCDTQRYEPINDNEFYRVVIDSYIAEGGDGFKMIAAGAKNAIEGPMDIDAITNYVEKNSPINVKVLAERITFV